MSTVRTAVFIDNSNIFHRLHELKGLDPRWVCIYDPLKLAKKLSGNRKLEYVGFYCVQPPSYLLSGDAKDVMRYKTTQRYYSTIEKLPLVYLKVGDLKGTRGSLVEKNLDTQLSTDMVAMAAQNKFDVAILVTNDGDYVSAAVNTKTFGKKVELVYFRGFASMNLRKECDVPRAARRSFFERLEFDGGEIKPS